jgi:hypothetical protein
VFYQRELAAYGDRVGVVKDFARLVGATSALLTGLDPDIASHTAETALENNFVQCAYLGILAAERAYLAYEIGCEFYDHGTEAGFNKLGITFALEFVGGKAVQFMGKAFPTVREAVAYALQKSPGLDKILGRFTGTLVEAGEALLATKLGRVAQGAAGKADAFASGIFDAVSERATGPIARRLGFQRPHAAPPASASPPTAAEIAAGRGARRSRARDAQSVKVEASAEPSASRVRKINGRRPINSEYAGKTYPREKLPPELIPN